MNFFYLQYIPPCDGNKIYRVSIPKFQPVITDSVYLKPWLNGLASRRNLLATPFGQALRALALTCAHFGRVQICTQVKVSFSPFGHPTQVYESWVTPINLLLANEIQDMLALKWGFCDSPVLVRKLASPFGDPTQVSTQVQLAATCYYLRFRLARAFVLCHLSCN